VTNDEGLAQRIRMFANHGRLSKYDHEFEGINSRLDTIQAAILDTKLPHVDRWNARRRAVAQRYEAGLSDVCITPATRPGSEHVYHLYVVRTARRDHVRSALAAHGISAGVHYPKALPLLAAYRHCNYSPSDYPVAARLQDEILSLPIHGDISDEDVDCVIHHVREAIGC
jgi:dTDP-4-amino-4,6-dideoxygalactose transaminase